MGEYFQHGLWRIWECCRTLSVISLGVEVRDDLGARGDGNRVTRFSTLRHALREFICDVDVHAVRDWTYCCIALTVRISEESSLKTGKT